MFIIYGAALSGEVACKYLANKGLVTLGFIDRNYSGEKEVRSKKYPVYSSIHDVPKELLDNCNHIIIAVGSSDVAEQIKCQLSSVTDIPIITVYDNDFEGGIIGKLNQPDELLKLLFNIYDINSFIITDIDNITMRRFVNENLSILISTRHHGFSYELVKYIHNRLKGAIAFDIGANRGYVTCALASKYNKVFSFEPSVDNYLSLMENVKLNRFENVIFENYACSSFKGEADFYEYDTHSHHSLGNSKIASPSRLVKVKTTTLDSYCVENEIDEINLLKIDVEGFELDVLIGAKQLMSDRKIQSIIFEYNPEVSGNLNKDSNETFDYLVQNNYDIYTLEGVRLYEPPIHMKVVDWLAIQND